MPYGTLQTKYPYIILRTPRLIDQLGELFDKEIEELKTEMRARIERGAYFSDVQDKIAELVGLRVQIDSLKRDRDEGNPYSRDGIFDDYQGPNPDGSYA